MAASVILLTPEELTREAASLNNAADQNDKVISDFDSIVNGLLSQWTGKAQQQFVDSYKTKRQVFKKMTDLMHELAKDITEFAKNMDSMESQHANIAKKLAH